MPRFIVLLCLALSGCASLPDNTAQPSYHIKPEHNNPMLQAIQRANPHIMDGEAGVLLLGDGVDALVARLSLINAATSSIDLQYYLYYSDLSAQLVTEALWKAALRGVRIRLLVDDMDLAGRDKMIAALSNHPNFEVRIFNPFIRGKNRAGQLVTQFGSITRRMHNKSLTVDNSISILGGRNIGDVYFAADPELAFGDLDVAINGTAVQDVTDSFDLYWNHSLSYPVELLHNSEIAPYTFDEISSYFYDFKENSKKLPYVKALESNDLVELLRHQKIKSYQGVAQVIYDHPDKIVSHRDKKKFHLAPQLAPYFSDLHHELIIVSPYFVPGKEGIAFFQALVDRGIHIKILTNSLQSNDVVVVHAGYAKYRKQLLAMGISLYEMDSRLFSNVDQARLSKSRFNYIGQSKSSLHAKYFILDNQRMFIGSLNLDPRSFNENTEIGVIIDSEELAHDVASLFKEHINKIAFRLGLDNGNITWTIEQNNEFKTYVNEPYTNWFERSVMYFMRILPGESQL